MGPKIQSPDGDPVWGDSGSPDAGGSCFTNPGAHARTHIRAHTHTCAHTPSHAPFTSIHTHAHGRHTPPHPHCAHMPSLPSLACGPQTIMHTREHATLRLTTAHEPPHTRICSLMNAHANTFTCAPRPSRSCTLTLELTVPQGHTHTRTHRHTSSPSTSQPMRRYCFTLISQMTKLRPERLSLSPRSHSCE